MILLERALMQHQRLVLNLPLQLDLNQRPMHLQTAVFLLSAPVWDQRLSKSKLSLLNPFLKMQLQALFPTNADWKMKVLNPLKMKCQARTMRKSNLPPLWW